MKLATELSPALMRETGAGREPLLYNPGSLVQVFEYLSDAFPPTDAPNLDFHPGMTICAPVNFDIRGHTYSHSNWDHSLFFADRAELQAVCHFTYRPYLAIVVPISWLENKPTRTFVLQSVFCVWFRNEKIKVKVVIPLKSPIKTDRPKEHYIGWTETYKFTIPAGIMCQEESYIYVRGDLKEKTHYFVT